jgi:shikimate dehydrogenase
MQNAAFGAANVDAVYLALKVSPPMLQSAVTGFRAIGLAGFNVTIPHKVTVMKWLDGLDASAADLGAVNTVVNREGRLIGHNTDGAGAIAALREAGVDPKGLNVVILGAGGAARAIAFSLAPRVESLVILNRTGTKASRLAKDVEKKVEAEVRGIRFTSENLRESLASADLLVNATSVGMHPKTEESLVEKYLLRSDLTVFDIVYNPLRTQLIRDAETVGAETMGGLSMLVYQGALAFELWTKKKAPIQMMLEALESRIGSG